jgi:phosphotransferase system enzyme I (PtsP)
MLTQLRKIIQEVNNAADLNEVLQLVTREVKEAINTQAASIFLVDQHRSEYVLMATCGLNAAAVGKVRLKLSQGLVGLVGQREEPINIKNAHLHPNFYPDPRVEEERYKAFLGVPIIHRRILQGVLIVQEEQERCYDEEEEAFLVTLCAQLSSVIAHAKVMGVIEGITAINEKIAARDIVTYKGIPCVAGVGIGDAVVIYPQADLQAVPDRRADNIAAEKSLFNDALQATREDIKKLAERLKESLPEEELLLFDVYLKMLDNNNIGYDVISEIEKGQWAQGALRTVIQRHAMQFAAMEDDYLRERITDIKDLGRRVLFYLQEKQWDNITYSEQTILIGDDISAAHLAEVPEGCLAGIVSGKGSGNSHVAILARALGIPTVMGVQDLQLVKVENKKVIVDGYYGHVYIDPTLHLQREFANLAREEQEMTADLQDLRDKLAETIDGHSIDLYVNMGMAIDASLAMSVGAGGVGLYRSEMCFMNRDRFPTEDEQYGIYRQLLAAFHPRPVAMRTLDIGGDKVLPYFPMNDANPYLGWRGIRVTLDHPELFLAQIRAMLRASIGMDSLGILLPMISTISELEEAQHLISRAYHELLEENLTPNKPRVGVMLEVPSAVWQTNAIAKRVDFMSVGSNDLTQYILAVDRGNSKVSGLYDCLHPAVLSALKHCVDSAHKEQKPISICGEMASDPVSVILLLAMGFDSLSINSSSLLKVKWVIRQFRLSFAKQLLEEIMTYESPAFIRFRLEQALDDAGLGGLIRAGKR